jgi:hypothetical protein
MRNKQNSAVCFAVPSATSFYGLNSNCDVFGEVLKCKRGDRTKNHEQ